MAFSAKLMLLSLLLSGLIAMTGFVLFLALSWGPGKLIATVSFFVFAGVAYLLGNMKNKTLERLFYGPKPDRTV